jgi:hypothetical protein
VINLDDFLLDVGLADFLLDLGRANFLLDLGLDDFLLDGTRGFAVPSKPQLPLLEGHDNVSGDFDITVRTNLHQIVI